MAVVRKLRGGMLRMIIQDHMWTRDREFASRLISASHHVNLCIFRYTYWPSCVMSATASYDQ